MTELTRAQALVAGGLTVSAILFGALAELADSAPSETQDAEILNFALLLEYVQAAFYAEALARAQLTGELRTFAETVGAHEKEHVRYLKTALGAAARPSPKLDFGEDTADAERFSVAAFKLEDLGVAAYNAQAPNLTKGALASAATVVSVEARHAAWIRDIRGLVPAPAASEPTRPSAQVIATLKGSGYVR